MSALGADAPRVVEAIADDVHRGLLKHKGTGGYSGVGLSVGPGGGLSLGFLNNALRSGLAGIGLTFAAMARHLDARWRAPAKGALVGPAGEVRALAAAGDDAALPVMEFQAGLGGAVFAVEASGALLGDPELESVGTFARRRAAAALAARATADDLCDLAALSGAQAAREAMEAAGPSARSDLAARVDALEAEAADSHYLSRLSGRADWGRALLGRPPRARPPSPEEPRNALEWLDRAEDCLARGDDFAPLARRLVDWHDSGGVWQHFDLPAQLFPSATTGSLALVWACLRSHDPELPALRRRV